MNQHNLPQPAARPPEIKLLTGVSILALLLLTCATLLAKLEAPYANLIALALIASMIASVYVAMSLVELKLAIRLMSLKSGLFLWLSVIGLLTWFSRIDAQVDVNTIFGVDASLLPMTTSAATFMRLLMHIVPAIYLIILLSALLFCFTYSAARLRNEWPWYAVCHVLNLLAFVLIASLVVTVISVDRRRNQILYHIAHMADFSGKSPCMNVDSMADDVLYLDSARDKILVAPKIKEREPTTLVTFRLLAPAPIPGDFKKLKCDYGISQAGR
jgi:hypothetical protein